MKLHKDINNWVPLHAMKDGDVAVIRRWNTMADEHIGWIVQRFEDTLIPLGKHSGSAYTRIFDKPHTNIEVEILTKGTTLEV